MQNISWIVALSLIYSNSALATLARLSQVSTQANCGRFSSELIEDKAYEDLGRGYLGESLRIFFDDFTLNASSTGKYDRNCKMTAAIEVPAGYRFRPTLAAAEGFYSIQPKNASRGGIKVSYVVQPGGQKAEQQNAKPFTDNGNILCKAELKDPRFTACYNRPHDVSLATDLGFWLDQAQGGQSLMQLDATRTKTSLKWNWQFQTCENFYDQRWFKASTIDSSNQYQTGRLFLDLTRGQLEFPKGRAELSGISYSADGLELSANWSLNGDKGWLKIKMKDISTGSYSGEWGNDGGAGDYLFGSYENLAAVPAKEYHAFHLPDLSQCLDSASSAYTDHLARNMPCDYSKSQLFYIGNVKSDQYFHIKAKDSGKCLSADPQDTPRFRACGEGAYDVWEFFSRVSSPFRLRNVATGLCLSFKDYTLGTIDCSAPEATSLTWSRR